MKLQIINGNIYTAIGWLRNSSIYCDDGKIVEVSAGNTPREGYTILDAQDYMVGPGGIDLHLHGGGGRDFMEGTEEAFRTAIHTHLIHGTTSLYPTLSSSSNKMIRDAAVTCTKLMEEPNTPVLGLHLEGPYFNINKCGGQWPEMIRLADPKEYIPLLDEFKCIKRWDAAPELPGALEFGKECTRRGVVVSLAHTEAGFEDVMKGLEAGYTHATHFYNAMTSVHNVREYKHEGTIESVYITDNITVEIVADGIHVPPVVIRLTHKLKGPERIALITDALATTGSNSDDVFDPNTIIEDGVAKLADRSALAGSIATMDRLVDTMINKCHMSWGDTFAMTSTTPARIMKVIDRKGTISVGKDADICIYTHNAILKYVIQMGEVKAEY